MPMDPETRELHPRDLPLSTGARALLLAFSDTIEREQGPGGSLAHVTGYASKAAEQAVRIAAVLTLWADLMAPAITAQGMASGIELAQFYLGEAVRLSDAALISAETSQAEELRLWLLDRWPEQARRIDRDPATITPKDAMQYGPNALREAKVARKLMGALADSGWLVALPEGALVGGMARKLAYQIVRPRDVV